MLNERRARLVVDADGAAHLHVDGSGPAGGGEAEAELTLLLDAGGGFVGVDFGGEGLARTVVMVGAHESVKETRVLTGYVTRDTSGQPCEIRFGRGLVRA